MKINYQLFLLMAVISLSAQNAASQFKSLINLSTGSVSATIDPIPSETNVTVPGFGNFDCQTDFWTVDLSGDIKLWRMVDNVITGGDIVLGGAGPGLAYCGAEGEETFYCSNYPNTGITKYENGDWVTIPTDVALLNNGGYGDDQYYFSLEDGVVKTLHHFDGTILSVVEELTSEFYTTADVAVDRLGQAWVFKGPSQFVTTKLCVYNSTGILNTYDINFGSIGTYGAFFLNDVLYIGQTFSDGITPDAIIPVTVSGTTASLGTPIEFISKLYSDMASCNGIDGCLSVGENTFTDRPEMIVYPNPSTGIINIKSKDDIFEMEILNLEGKSIKKFIPLSQLDISDLPNQTYILKIKTSRKTYSHSVVKR